ncbi:MAG: hydrogenase maturation nickel metallochaperone HypA [Terriglobia bacterium]
MHEASLMKDLMSKILAISREQKGARVVGVSVRLGALSHMSAGHFREHFAVAAQGTAAEGAKLKIEELSDTNDPMAQQILLESVEVEE